MVVFKNAAIIFAALFFISCSNLQNRKSGYELESLMKSGQYDTALSLVQSEKFYHEKESRLIKFLEIGTISFLKGNYYHALKAFDQAKELSDSLFTVSMSKKVKSFVINDLSDNYYGEIYERSLIRYYQALSHFMISQSGKYEPVREDFLIFEKPKSDKDSKTPVKTSSEIVLNESQKKTHRHGAKATLLEWDSMLDDYRARYGSKILYKEDLSAKLVGAFIHESMGTRNDQTIAKKLYEEAKVVLLKNYNGLDSFNKKAKVFRDNLDKFSKMNIKKVKEEFIDETDVSKSLVSYIDDKIKNINKRFKSKKSFVGIIIESGFIAKKTPETTDFPIGFSTLPVGISSERDFTSFVRKVLSVSAGTAPTISFETPVVKNKTSMEKVKIVIKDKDKKTVLQETELPLINPLSNLAFVALDEELGAIKTKIGLRVASKHLAALGTSFIAYRSSVKTGGSEFLASAIAGASYAIANKGIKESERVDTRSWSTLPSDIYFSQIELPVGEYYAEVKYVSSEKVVSSFSFIIEDKSQIVLKRI